MKCYECGKEEATFSVTIQKLSMKNQYWETFLCPKCLPFSRIEKVTKGAIFELTKRPLT